MTLSSLTRFSAAAAIMAASAQFAGANELWPLSQACEIALAESAAPTYVRENAGVYVLGTEGYELVKPAENEFVCLVQRNSSESLIPQCFDEIGQQVHVAVHLDEGKKIRAGMSFDQIQKERAAGFYSGKYSTAKGHGVVYMASDYNYNVSPKRRVKIAPHVMYHAPGVTNEDIGSVPGEAFQNKGMPFIAGQGPMGFMISFTERATDSDEVISACDGELPDPESFMPFPPPAR